MIEIVTLHQKKKGVQMTNKCMKKYLILLVITERQIEMAMLFYTFMKVF